MTRGNGHEHPWAETLKRGSADKRLLVGAWHKEMKSEGQSPRERRVTLARL